MKQYPSIPRSTGQSYREIKNAYIFDKLDGSQMRAEYNKKQGFYKFGTKGCLIDEKDKNFGNIVTVFNENTADPLIEIFHNNKWDKVTVFGEYYGIQSFAGRHIDSDPKFIKIFDVAIHKHGIMGPKDFLKYFKYINMPNFIGIYNWNHSFIEKVYNTEINGITFEGVIGKYGEGHNLVMAKAKTKLWLDKIHEKFDKKEADELINS